MSKRCPECLRMNEDARPFCTYCGATLDPHLRLIQDLERQKDSAPQQQTNKRKEDMSFYVPRSAPQQKKKSAAPWIILVLIAVTAVAIWFFMNG